MSRCKKLEIFCRERPEISDRSWNSSFSSLYLSLSLFVIHRRKTVSSNMAHTCREKIGVYVSETKKIGEGISESGSRNDYRSGWHSNQVQFFRYSHETWSWNGVVNLSWNRAVSGIGRSRRVFRFAMRSSRFQDWILIRIRLEKWNKKYTALLFVQVGKIYK